MSELFGVLIEQNILSINRHFNTFLFKVRFLTPATLLLSTAVNKMAVQCGESLFRDVLEHSGSVNRLAFFRVPALSKDVFNEFKNAPSQDVEANPAFLLRWGQ